MIVFSVYYPQSGCNEETAAFAVWRYNYYLPIYKEKEGRLIYSLIPYKPSINFMKEEVYIFIFHCPSENCLPARP